MGDVPKKLETETGQPVGYNFAVGFDLGSGRTIQMTGVFPIGVKPSTINAEFDKIVTALNRQQAKVAIYGIEAELEKIDQTLNSLKESLADAEARFKGKVIPTNEQMNHSNLKVSVRDLTAKRKNVEALLKRTRAEAE